MTFLEFRQLVNQQLTDITADDDFAYSVLADYVKSRLAREVDHDIQLFRSYSADYQRNRLRLIGYNFTADAVTIQAAVRERLTVDADREGAQAFINHQVAAGITDIETLSTFIDQKLRQALLDLQTYIVPFRVGHSTSYTNADVVSELNASRLLLPDQAEVRDIYFVRSYPELAEGAEYTLGDLVVSNGILYKVLVGGTLLAGELGDGLHAGDLEDSADSNDDDETATLGELQFEFFSYRTCCRWRMHPYPYRDRSDLAYGSKCVTCSSCGNDCESCSCDESVISTLNACTDNCGNSIASSDCVTQSVRGPFYYSIDPHGRTMYVYPKLDDDHKVVVFWDGIRIDFTPGDTVPMGERAVEAVAAYVQSSMRQQAEDPQTASRHMQQYVLLRSQMFVDGRNRTRSKYLN